MYFLKVAGESNLMVMSSCRREDEKRAREETSQRWLCGTETGEFGKRGEWEEERKKNALHAHTLMVTSVLLPWFFIDMTDTLEYASESA